MPADIRVRVLAIRQGRVQLAVLVNVKPEEWKRVEVPVGQELHITPMSAVKLEQMGAFLSEHEGGHFERNLPVISDVG